MDDLISRQQAIDAVQHAFDRETLLNSFIRKVAMDALNTIPSAQPKQDREFMKLIARNSNGRPYFSIIYLEFDDNGIGRDFEGYSSYSLDVISDYLKKYFMPSAQPVLDGTKISDLLERIYSIQSVHLSVEGVLARKYFCEELWKEIFGSEAELPAWLM